MKYDFISIGDITTDAFIDLKEGMHIDEPHGAHGKAVCLNFGDKIEYEDAVVVRGVGNAANAAVSAHRLGLSTALVTDIGTDENGDKCLAAWEHEGLDTSFVRRHEAYPTHYHYVLRYGPERTILIKHNPWPYEVPSFPETPAWAYFTSTGEHGEPYHHDIARFVKENDVKLAFQPGSFQITLGAERIADIYEASEVFFCNKEEARRILGTEDGNVTELLKRIRALGPTIAVVTDGPNGAYASDGTNSWFVPMYPDPAPPIDRTGAGDAFSSTVTACLANGMALPDALLRGPVNSMSVVQYIGAQEGLLSLEQLDAYLTDAPDDYEVRRIS